MSEPLTNEQLSMLIVNASCYDLHRQVESVVAELRAFRAATSQQESVIPEKAAQAYARLVKAKTDLKVARNAVARAEGAYSNAKESALQAKQDLLQALEVV